MRSWRRVQEGRDEEGWTPEHDDEHINGVLAEAAICYVEAANRQTALGNMTMRIPDRWPWESCWWKPSLNRVRNLVKAGALIAAEIDRLQRKA